MNPHYSVLLKESIEFLALKPNGVYVDGTLGRGGHTRWILNNLDENGRLIAFDRDIEAINYAKAEMPDSRLMLIHDNFANILEHLSRIGIDEIDGVILDLGVSSPQLDDGMRGFSFNKEAVLDMRMDNTKGESAYEWINRAHAEEIAEVLWVYGEERFAKKIAHNIVKSRDIKPIKTTLELANIIANSIPRSKQGDKHPATRSFMAIRIHINDELGSLKNILEKLPKLLKIGARAVIISFHSLEDRIVKNFFNNLAQQHKLPKWVMQQEEVANYKIIGKKIKASVNELMENPRSRSAILRVIERLK